ncbi:Uncharacterised protein [Mycobacteroides abscessus subsp. abscessus]|nr:Uncharacterised protein [Mycobacteroides abscessus subsp. abscessus]
MSTSWPRPKARVPASGSVVTTRSSSTEATSSGLKPADSRPPSRSRNERAGVLFARPSR